MQSSRRHTSNSFNRAKSFRSNHSPATASFSMTAPPRGLEPSLIPSVLDLCGQDNAAVTTPQHPTGTHFNVPLDSNEHDAPATLPPGRTVRVYNPCARHLYQECPSEQILLTKGSHEFWQDPQLGLRQFHCAHFYSKKLCLRGAQCTFIHAVPKRSNAAATPMPPMALDPHNLAVVGVDESLTQSSNNDESPRSTGTTHFSSFADSGVLMDDGISHGYPSPLCQFSPTSMGVRSIDADLHCIVPPHHAEFASLDMAAKSPTHFVLSPSPLMPDVMECVGYGMESPSCAPLPCACSSLSSVGRVLRVMRHEPYSMESCTVDLVFQL